MTQWQRGAVENAKIPSSEYRQQLVEIPCGGSRSTLSVFYLNELCLKAHPAENAL